MKEAYVKPELEHFLLDDDLILASSHLDVDADTMCDSYGAPDSKCPADVECYSNKC